MRVLVTGGRAYADQKRVFETLDRLHREHGISLVIQGEAQGADLHARAWAYKHAVPCMGFRAPWNAVGRGAGLMRNGWMLEFGKPERVYAFPGGKGTANMVMIARTAHIEVVEVA